MKKQRIVIFSSNGSGSDYHRLNLPSKYLQGEIIKIGEENIELDFVTIDLPIENKVIKEEMLQQGDIIWFNWLIANAVADIGTWRASKGIKLLYSIDDYWHYSENHPYLNKLMKMKDRVLQFAFEADIVISSTERLGQHLIKLNPFVSYNPNFLPIGEGQFISNKIDNEKLRVGLVGSYSHLPDYKLLKGTINRIGNNKELCDKIEFHIFGYTDQLIEIKNMFSKKKHIKLFTHEAVPPSDYIKLYDNLDVILLPLEDIEYNYCKSALKLAECLVSNTIPIGSKLYDGKELTGFCKAETPLEYENWLIYLSDKENYKKTLEYLKRANENNNFEERIENLKTVFNVLCRNNFKSELDDVKIFGITYDSSQITQYIHYDNSHIKTLEQKSWRFEYNPIIDIVSNKIDNYEGYLGVFSWKFPQKTGLTKKLLAGILNENNYKNYDFINLSRNYWKSSKEYLNFSYEKHPKLKEILIKVLNNLNIEYSENLPTCSYSNFFLMETKLWKEYVNNWIIPSLNYMENEIWNEVNVDANYTSGVNKEKLLQYSGMEFYNYVTFTLERLILFYIKEKQLKVLNLL